MAFYKNRKGEIAKLLKTDSHIIVMFAFKTMFFNNERSAHRFLVMNGFTF